MVTLDTNDIRIAAHVAFDRGWPSLMAGLTNRNGGSADPFYRHVIGALGECVFAKYANIYWDGSVNRFKGMGKDVGNFQIRARSGPLPLIIRPADADADTFVLVYKTTSLTHWEVAGWMGGAEGKQIGKLTAMQGGERYQIEIAQLHPMSELRIA